MKIQISRTIPTNRRAIIRETIREFSRLNWHPSTIGRIELIKVQAFPEAFPSNAYGWCEIDQTNEERRPNRFNMAFHSKLGIEKLIKIVIHESTHVRQFATCKFNPSVVKRGALKVKWDGRLYAADMPYEKQPWEQEAVANEFFYFYQVRAHLRRKGLI
jgi:hypothetical protein